jgi:hypothetical protein
MLENTWFWFCQSRKFAGEIEKVLIPGKLLAGGVCHTRTSRSESGKGRERSNTPFTTEKIAVLAPMPSARVMTATAANPGAFRTCRAANRKS